MKTSYKLLTLVTLVVIFLCSCQSSSSLPEITPNVQVSISPTEVSVASTSTPVPVVQFQMPQLETITDISNMVGIEHQPFWSPDGTKIVFVMEDRLFPGSGFRKNIYLMNVDGSQQMILTEPAPETDYLYPSWSPDGSNIIYVQIGNSISTINTMLPDGSRKAELINCDFACQHPKWSPDGRSIIYFEAGGDSPILIVKYDISSEQKIILYQNDSLNYRGGDLSLSYSPDGKNILFHTSGETQTQDGSTSYDSTIYIMNANGGNLRKIINGDFPSWHPDGTKIIFGMQDSYRHNIYISNPDGTELTKYIFYGDEHVGQPVWSPNGDWILFVSNRSTAAEDNTGTDIFVVKTQLVDVFAQNTDTLNNLDENPETCSTNAKFIATVDASVRQSGPSPDMNMIAFISEVDGDNDVYVMNMDGSGKRKITDNQFDDMVFQWFPDSKSLAVMSNQGSTFVLYSINLDAPDQQNILAQGVLSYDISPDGKSIVYTGYEDDSQGAPRSIFIMDADGGNKVQLIQTESGSEDPTWSPDGSKIYFGRLVQTSKVVGSDYFGKGHMLSPQIMSMNRDGTDVKVLTNSDAVDYIGRISPDGQTILFISDRDQADVFKVYKMGLNGENQITLTGNPSEYADWWPDGNRISVFHLIPEGGKLSDGYVVDTNGNFLMELPEILKQGFGWLSDKKRVFFDVKNNYGTINLCVATMSDLIP